MQVPSNVITVNHKEKHVKWKGDASLSFTYLDYNVSGSRTTFVA